MDIVSSCAPAVPYNRSNRPWYQCFKTVRKVIFFDDMLVYEASKEEHDQRLETI
jgi:hypothetical protein